MGIGCIVLAAGHSRRFGAADKLTEELGGRPLLRWTLDAIPRDAFHPLCAVVSSEAVAEICREADFPYVLYGGGALSDSIRAGLSALPENLEGYMFLNGDRPFVKPRTLCRMAEAFLRAPDRVLRLGNSNPVIFPANARGALMELTGDRGGSALLRGGIWPVDSLAPEEEREIRDADTPAALERLRQSIETER